jgi:thioredoxin 1
MVTLYDFYADWCGPCKMMDPVIDALEEEYEGCVDFEKVDVDAQSDVASRNNVQSLPTFIVKMDDVEQQRFVGVTSGDDLRAALDEYLD